MHAQGYNATGVAEIVERASAPKGTFYNHFESKEAFALLVVDRFFERVFSLFEARMQDPAGTPRARLRGYFEDRAAFFEANGCQRGCLLGNFGLEMSDQSEIIRARLQAHFDTWTARMATCIEAAQRAGEVRAEAEPGDLAQFILSSWEGALLSMRIQKSTAPLHAFLRFAFDGVLGAQRPEDHAARSRAAAAPGAPGSPQSHET